MSYTNFQNRRFSTRVDFRSTEIQRFIRHSGGLLKYRNSKIHSALGWTSEVQKSKDSFSSRVASEEWKKPSFVSSKLGSVSREGLPSSEEQKKLRFVWWTSEDQKTKIRRVDFRRIDEPRFVSAFGSLSVGYMGSAFGSWVLNIRVRPLVLEHWIRISFGSWAFGYIGFDFRLGSLDIWGLTFDWALDIWVLTFGWALDIWISAFGSWILDIWVSTFGWALDIWISAFGYWALNIWNSAFGSWVHWSK
ncbi:unnamed protein product [Rhizophagus irregularis]|nr:unnamed protein product [Rhizophagus irregularis]